MSDRVQERHAPVGPQVPMLHFVLFVLVCLVAAMVWFLTWQTVVTAIHRGHVEGLRQRWTRRDHPTRFWLTLAGWFTLTALMCLTFIATFEYIIARLRFFDGR